MKEETIEVLNTFLTPQEHLAFQSGYRCGTDEIHGRYDKLREAFEELLTERCNGIMLNVRNKSYVNEYRDKYFTKAGLK